MVDTATTRLALVPLRNNTVLRNTKSKHGVIQMPADSESMIIGRKELVPCVFAGCGCDSNSGSTSNKCQECQGITSWASKALSRHMLRFTSSKLSVRGQFASVWIDDSSEPIQGSSNNDDDDDDWTGNEPFHEGTKLTLKPQKGSGILEFRILSIDQLTKEIVSTRSKNLQEGHPTPTEEDQESCEPPSQSMETQFQFPLPFSSLLEDPPPTTPIDDLGKYLLPFSAKTPRVKNTFKDHDPEKAHVTMASSPQLQLQLQPGPEEMHPAKNETTMINEARQQPSQSTSQPDEACAVVSHQDPPGVSGSQMISPPEDPPGLSPLKPLVTTKDTVIPPTAPIVDEHNAVSPPALDDLNRKGGDETNTPSIEMPFRLFFCPLGQDMSQARIAMLSKNAVERGAKIVQDFHDATHLIISCKVCALEQVAKQLGLKEEELVQHLDNKQVRCVGPTWIVESVGEILEQPGRMDSWSGYQPHKRKSTLGCRSVKKKKRLPLGSKNKELAEMFEKMSKLHQSCPLLETDLWKAYQLNLIAGRLRNIDFEIVNDPDVLKMLKGVKGIGASSLEKIQEYLSTGSMSRIKEFETDPRRVAMKKMMDIWGVGRVKASKLVHDGYTNIDQVLRDVKIGRVDLDRNQLVGVECYEDILDKMGPEEVENIGGIISDTVKRLLPNAEIQIMGSYRRGKESCGDVDIHVTCLEYQKQVPDEALGKIVDTLWREEHLSFHLTFLPGMETGCKSEDYHKSSRHVPNEAWETRKEKASPHGKAREGHSSSSYMGIFNSPTAKHKRRRVDIKFYPYRERIFASLYFTGNGHFNRSMRLWAARKFNLTLNDHGLFQRGTQDRVMEASREKEVFDRLGLVYKEPEDRDCFDAVVLKSGIQAAADLEMSKHDLREDNENVWIY